MVTEMGIHNIRKFRGSLKWDKVNKHSHLEFETEDDEIFKAYFTEDNRFVIVQTGWIVNEGDEK